MGMSTHVIGIREPDDHWRTMKAVWDACEQAHVEPPSEVEDFFDGTAPDPAGITIDLDHGDHNIAVEWSNDYATGLEIPIAELPPNITKIRFYNSW